MSVIARLKYFWKFLFVPLKTAVGSKTLNSATIMQEVPQNHTISTKLDAFALSRHQHGLQMVS